jgi:hypothetical protein
VALIELRSLNVSYGLLTSVALERDLLICIAIDYLADVLGHTVECFIVRHQHRKCKGINHSLMVNYSLNCVSSPYAKAITLRPNGITVTATLAYQMTVYIQIGPGKRQLDASIQ